VTRLVGLSALCGIIFVYPALAQVPPAAGAPASKGSTLSDAERTRVAADSIERMRGTVKQTIIRVEDARNEKDVVKLSCVNEKLTQMKGLLKVAEQSSVAFKEALAAKDPLADTEYAKIGIARSKIDALGNDAQQCIGQLAYIVDEKTTVEVQQPPGLPERETSGHYRPNPPPASPVVTRPPSASAFQ
jgi:hypothetical protein